MILGEVQEQPKGLERENKIIETILRMMLWPINVEIQPPTWISGPSFPSILTTEEGKVDGLAVAITQAAAEVQDIKEHTTTLILDIKEHKKVASGAVSLYDVYLDQVGVDFVLGSIKKRVLYWLHWPETVLFILASYMQERQEQYGQEVELQDAEVVLNNTYRGKDY
ncbi:hypothetical protein Tco_0413962 [Tanacetum coccineum]